MSAYHIEASDEYGQNATHKLKIDGYSETVFDHWLKPRNLDPMSGYDGYSGQTTSSCGDSMWIWLKVKNDIIQKATFISDICFGAVVSGSMLTELSSGERITYALQISPDDVINALGGLPPQYVHCAKLGCNALKNAIIDYNCFRDAPWKRLYSRQ